MIITERLYGYSNNKHCYKLLVDRLWPRGVSKNEAIWDEWMKEIAPSNELRMWFGHKQEKWEEFKKRYIIELSQKKKEIQRIKDLEKIHGTVVLLYGARDTVYNQANIIRDIIVQDKT